MVKLEYEKNFLYNYNFYFLFKSILFWNKTNFSNGMPIPKEHACKKKGGKDLSIPIEFINIPENTKSFALIIDDPDAIQVAG